MNFERTRAIFLDFVLLFPVFLTGLFGPLSRSYSSTFSEWNSPKPRHLSLLRSALQLQNSRREKPSLWIPLVDQGWRPCINPRNTSPAEKRKLYLQVFLDGGLNQQRMGICDAVAIARIINATLLIPHFEMNPVWKDSSGFTDIFDVDHFIDVLKDDVSIVKELPDEFYWSTRDYYAMGIRATRIKNAPVHASSSWYIENVLPVLQSYGIAAISPFSHRLAFDNLPVVVQRLRCKVNFQALVFVPHVLALGDALINRLRFPETVGGIDEYKSSKFVVLHLRFDKDMAAHSVCDFGGGKAEKLALAKYRQVIWKGRVVNSEFTDEELRSQGRCPLTPEEIGLLLVALGFNNMSRLYLASHKVYGGEYRISALKKLFPRMEDKRSLASSEEQTKIKGRPSLQAAVDYHVALHSNIFISASPGNMHNALVGHRTYNNLKTIRPNMALLGQLFLNKTMSWQYFQQAVINGHRNRHGQIRVRKPNQSIYTYPVPDCMCLNLM